MCCIYRNFLDMAGTAFWVVMCRLRLARKLWLGPSLGGLMAQVKVRPSLSPQEGQAWARPGLQLLRKNFQILSIVLLDVCKQSQYN